METQGIDDDPREIVRRYFATREQGLVQIEKLLQNIRLQTDGDNLHAVLRAGPYWHAISNIASAAYCNANAMCHMHLAQGMSVALDRVLTSEEKAEFRN